MLRFSVCVVVLVFGMVGCGYFNKSDEPAWKEAARQRVTDHLWPLFVVLVDQATDIEPQDKARLIGGIGVLLALEGRIAVEDASSPEVIKAKAHSFLNRYSASELDRLTDILLDEAALAEYRSDLDAVTLEVSRKVTVQ